MCNKNILKSLSLSLVISTKLTKSQSDDKPHRREKRERESFWCYGVQQCGGCGRRRRLNGDVAADVEDTVVAEDQHKAASGHGGLLPDVSVESFGSLFMDFYVSPS